MTAILQVLEQFEMFHNFGLSLDPDKIRLWLLCSCCCKLSLLNAVFSFSCYIKVLLDLYGNSSSHVTFSVKNIHSSYCMWGQPADALFATRASAGIVLTKDLRIY